MFIITAAIGVVKVLVNVPPFGDDVIPVVFHLVDDDKIEPMDIYQLMIVNFSDTRAVVGDVDTIYIIVNDDDVIEQPYSYTYVRYIIMIKM